MVCLAHTVHLSCTDTNTVSKQKEARFHMSHITYEFHRVRPKQFMSLMVHSAQTMHLSCDKISTISKRTNRASTWASSNRSTIRCVQNDFIAYGTFGANRAPILHRHQHYLQTDKSEIPYDPHHLGVPSVASEMIFEPIVHSVQTVHLSCVKISTISKWSEPTFDFSLIT
jgi:hypothetical protein